MNLYSSVKKGELREELPSKFGKETKRIFAALSPTLRREGITLVLDVTFTTSAIDP